MRGEYSLIHSQPSCVEDTFQTNFLRTMLAHIFKFGYRIFGPPYNLVGGWEVAITRSAQN